MINAEKVSDDEMLQDLQMLPQGVKQVCLDYKGNKLCLNLKHFT